MTTNGLISVTWWVIKILVYKYGNLRHLGQFLYLSMSRPMEITQFTSLCKWCQTQGYRQSSGNYQVYEEGDRGDPAMPENNKGHPGGGGFHSSSYSLLGPVTEIPDPMGGTHFPLPTLTIWGGGKTSLQGWRKVPCPVSKVCYCSHSCSGTRLTYSASLYQGLGFTGGSEDTLFIMATPTSSPVRGIQ